jgi:glycosyltransferase involved in cell wall biosynthesis
VSAALWLLKEIWPLIHRQIPDAQLDIVGGSPDVRMKQFHARDNVSIVGQVDDVRPYLSRARVVLAPIFEGAGMRTKVLEAWAMAKPVVGTALSFEGFDDVEGQLGYVADTAEQFATRTCELLGAPDLARSMGERARRLVEQRYSWEAFAQFYDAVYAGILGEAQSSASYSRGVPEVVNVGESGRV